MVEALKPILFAANAQSFSNNGIGRLDLVKCVVTEERNGIYELAAEISVDSPHFSDIANNMVIYAAPGDGMGAQPFRIYRISEPLHGLVTIDARHISYDLSYNTAMPYTAGSVSEAFVSLKAAAVETCPFTFWTDKSTVANQKITTPRSMRACLGGQQGSILDVYGGEFGWDNFQVRLYGQRGSDTAVTLRYGKNITDLTQEQNLENVITGIVPFWASEDTVITLPEKSIDSTYAASYPYKRTIPVDFSSDFENAPTAAQLRARGNAYITANNIGVPKVSIKVSFIALWQTEEYKDIAPLERVNLCDTVGVVFERYGINTRAKVIRTEWDVLAERYLSIELGEARSNLASTIVKIDDETKQEVQDTKTELQSAIEAASAAISGVDGGYLKIKSNADGKPYEMLIMDTEDEATAEVIWRYNMAGWGAWIAAWGKTGGIPNYRLAATLNSVNGAQINADYITAGHMSCNLLSGGVLKSNDSDNDPNFILNMLTGGLTAKALEIITSTLKWSSSAGTIISEKTESGKTNRTTIGNGYVDTYYADTLHEPGDPEFHCKTRIANGKITLYEGDTEATMSEVGSINIVGDGLSIQAASGLDVRISASNSGHINLSGIVQKDSSQTFNGTIIDSTNTARTVVDGIILQN